MGKVARVVHDFSLRAMMALCFAIYIAFIFFLSLSIPESLFLVVVGFLPVLVYLAVVFTILRFGKGIVELLYLLPLVFSILYYVAWMFSFIPELAAMDGGVLAVLNLVVSYIYAMILSFVHPVRKKNHTNLKNHKSHMGKDENAGTFVYKKSKSIQKQELDEVEVKTTIRAIEDKCKAINFVVGRVYSDKKGGSKSIREKILIPRELYNAFSELTDDAEKSSGFLAPKGEEYGNYDKLKLLSVVEEIYVRLKRLKHPEKELFVVGKAKLPVERDESGNDSVLEVLANNDKDPVEDYHKAAIGVCEQVVEYLRKSSGA